MKVHKDIKQRSPEWFALRLGKITGTRLKQVHSTKSLELVDELVSEDLAQIVEESYISGAMQRGVDCENIALEDYKDLTGEEVEEVGFVEADSENFENILGLSPDALVNDGLKYIGGVEIKCPNSKAHLRYIRQNKLPAEYKYQVYMYFLVCDDLEWVDFVSWDDRITVYPIHIIRINRKDILEELEQSRIKLVDITEKKKIQLDNIMELSNL